MSGTGCRSCGRRSGLGRCGSGSQARRQTRVGNLGKLTRFEHRVKTHGKGWRHRQPEPGVHHWRTPTGHEFTVDHTGTHPGWVSTSSTITETAYERAFRRLVTEH